MTTRFWTCECCVQKVFRWKLFQLPAAEVLKTSVKKQHQTNAKRIVRVRALLAAPETRFELAVACLCLRLTSLATSITGQKSRTTRSGETHSDDRSPLMVRLAQGGPEPEDWQRAVVHPRGPAPRRSFGPAARRRGDAFADYGLPRGPPLQAVHRVPLPRRPDV